MVRHRDYNALTVARPESGLGLTLPADAVQILTGGGQQRVGLRIERNADGTMLVHVFGVTNGTTRDTVSFKKIKGAWILGIGNQFLLRALGDYVPERFGTVRCEWKQTAEHTIQITVPAERPVVRTKLAGPRPQPEPRQRRRQPVAPVVVDDTDLHIENLKAAAALLRELLALPGSADLRIEPEGERGFAIGRDVLQFVKVA